MKDFITGAELLKRWKCEDWQLLQIIKANSKENRLQPHDKATLSEIEIDPSIKYYVSGHLGHHGQRQYTSAEILPILHDCLFRLAHVALIETEKSESEEPSQTAEEYINTALDKKIKNEIIAFELKEHFGWTNLKIARHFKLGEDLQPGQIDALKQRGQRFCEKGKKIKT